MRKFTFIALLGLIAFNSCEKVIQLDLNDGEEQYVVDAMVSNVDKFNYVKLTRSATFYDNNDFLPVENASVIITDGNGLAINLLETSPGFYENPLLVGQSYMDYTLKIEVDGDIIEGSTYLPGNSAIDSLVTLQNQGGFFGTDFTAFAYWSDNANEKNYYRLRAYKNDTMQTNIYITEDNLYNGISTGTPLFSTSYKDGDSAIVELMQINERTYKYWLSLDQISNPQNQPAAPGNPISNMSNGALGYFGGYNMDIDTVVVEK
jgi:hypothetical protein